MTTQVGHFQRAVSRHSRHRSTRSRLVPSARSARTGQNTGLQENAFWGNPYTNVYYTGGRLLLSPVKGKFQLRFLVGFLLAAGSLVIAVLIVRAEQRAIPRKHRGRFRKGW